MTATMKTAYMNRFLTRASRLDVTFKSRLATEENHNE